MSCEEYTRAVGCKVGHLIIINELRRAVRRVFIYAIKFSARFRDEINIIADNRQFFRLIRAQFVCRRLGVRIV